jgi:hypothetical protein
MSIDFHLLTSCTTRNVILDKDCHSWPPIVMLYEFQSLKLARVFRRQSIVITFYDPLMKYLIRWNVASS